MPARLRQDDRGGRAGTVADALPTLLTGAALGIGAALLVWLDDLLDLQVGPVVLTGVALGAVVGLVPVRSAVERLGGFAAGVLVALGCYLVRAATLPDAVSGLAVAAVLTVVLCTAVALLSLDRLPLWSLLLGAGAFAGVYERTYAAAVAETATTSVNTVTALALTVAVGFLVAAIVPRPRATRTAPVTTPTTPADAPTGAHTLEANR